MNCCKNPSFLFFSSPFFSLEAVHCPAALCLCAARWGLGSCGLHGAAPMRRHLRDDGTCGMTCQGGEAREGSGLGFFLPKSKFAIQEITSYFSSEAHFCPLRVLRGDMDQRCTVAGKIKLRSGISCFIPYVYIFFSSSFTNFIHTLPSRGGKKPNPNSASFVFVSMGIL